MRTRACLTLNLLMAVIVLAAWGRMTFAIDASGALSASGLANLKYFTVLSNLLEALAALAMSAWLVGSIRGRARPLPRSMRLLNYAATTSVGLTFTVVVTFLGPLYGYASMFSGANLWFHLVVPVAAVFNFCVLDPSGPVPLRDAGIAVLPMLVYGVSYTANILINGVGAWPNTNDWYGFAAGGLGTIPFVFAAITLADLAIALLIRLPRRKN